MTAAHYYRRATRRRLAAWLVDFIAVGLFTAPVAMLTTHSDALFAAALGAYSTVGHARWGATLGKAAFGIRVVRDDGGRAGWWRCSWRALVFLAGPFSGHVLAGLGVWALANVPWWNSPIASELLLLFFNLDYPLVLLWAGGAYVAFVLTDAMLGLLSPRGRSLHDRAAGTIVVSARELTAQRNDSPQLDGSSLVGVT